MGGFYSGAGSAVLKRMIKPRGVGHAQIWPRVGSTPGQFVGRFGDDCGWQHLPSLQRAFKPKPVVFSVLTVFLGFWGVGLFLEEVFYF